MVAARVGHESIYITTHYMHAYSEMENAICEMMDKDMAWQNAKRPVGIKNRQGVIFILICRQTVVKSTFNCSKSP